MTFYEVEIYSANLAGRANDLTVLMAAMDSVEKHFEAGLLVNAKWCSECVNNPFAVGAGNSRYHVFKARELPILEIIETGKFTWQKKKGLGRATANDYLREAVANGTELWFQLELSEF